MSLANRRQLGLWIEETERTRFWPKMLNDLMTDVLSDASTVTNQIFPLESSA